MHTISQRLQALTAALLCLFLASCNIVKEQPDKLTTAAAIQPAGSFVWHDLITHDLQKARRFYGGLFGWTFERAPARDGHPYQLAKIEGHFSAGLLEIDRPEDGSNYARWLGYMRVKQLDKALKIASENGGSTITKTEQRSEVGWVAAIEDPEKAVLGLIESDLNSAGLVHRDEPGAVVWDELLASNTQAAAQFYENLAGVASQTIQRRGGDYTLLQSGDHELAGILDNPFKSTDPLWLSYFAVSDPAATAARVEALGGKVLLAPSPELREGSMALIQDPDGAILALQKWPL